MEIKPIKLSSKKSGSGYVTSYTINIGSAEARKCGFIAEDGTVLAIEKVLDIENNQIIIRLSQA